MSDEISWTNKFIFSKVDAIRLYSSQFIPGIFFCLVVVMASRYISEHYGTPLILGALLLGMAFNNISKYQEFTVGLDFCAKTILRCGVALLGVRITLSQILKLGYEPVLLVVTVVITTLVFSLLLARILKLGNIKGIISGAAVAICGASAAMAVAAVLDKNNDDEQHLLCTLVVVTGLSTIVMIAYPGLLISLGLNTHQMGLFLGASIHDVAQVFGAGHMISEEVAELATYTKMLRVAMLVPTVICLAFFFRTANAKGTPRHSLMFPPFLIAFVVLVLISNLQLIPTSAINILSDSSQLCLWIAMAALGTKTNLLEMWHAGRRAFILLVLNTLFIGGIAFLMVM